MSFLSALLRLWLLIGTAQCCPSVCECKWKGGKQSVECRNRGLITLPATIESETQVLDLSGNNLQILPREAFSKANLLNLQKIFLQGCRLGQVDSVAFYGLSNLVDLDISDNLLTNIPSESFRDTPSLRELRLSGNAIQRIENNAFEHLAGLVKLDLSDCRIRSIAPKAFDNLNHLSHLKLNGNSLTELSNSVIASLTRLHSIELNSNPWICDCRLRGLREWFGKFKIPSPIPPACTAPTRLAGKVLIDTDLDEFACVPEAIQSTPRHVDVPIGDNVSITCHIQSFPEPEISWLWRGRPLLNQTLWDYDGDTTYPQRSVSIMEQGNYEKTSVVKIVSARELDSGEFICIGANRAGLAQVNFTLTVEARAPASSTLGSAHLAGLGAGLFLLLALVIVALLLFTVRLRTRQSRGRKDDGDQGNKTAANGSVVNDSHGFVKQNGCERKSSDILHPSAEGEYQCMQTDSLYPSSIMDQGVRPKVIGAEQKPIHSEEVNYTKTLPRNYSQWRHTDISEEQSNYGTGSLPRRFLGNSPRNNTYSVPQYPHDYGLPRSSMPSSAVGINPVIDVSGASSYGSKSALDIWTSLPPSATSSPAMGMSPRVHLRHKVIRGDSPDEGYQDEGSAEV